MITVKKVITKKQQKEFLEFPLSLYKDNPYFVPSLYLMEKDIFKKNYGYYDTCEAVCFNAYLDNKVVGRIQAILQKASNEKYNQKRIRFTRFDCIDNQDVANALFDKVKEYALDKNMNELVGPLGFSDLEREGLLIEGFDKLSTFEEQYNYDYYQRLIENYGFEKEVDWVEHQLRLLPSAKERLDKYSSLILKRFNLKVSKCKSVNEFMKRYLDQFFDIIDETYKDLYGTVPFTESSKAMLTSTFKLIVNERQVKVIVDENDRVVCFGICFPSLSKAVQKSQGKLTIPCLFRLLNAIKNPKSIDLGLIGVLPEYAKKGVATILLKEIMDLMIEDNLEYAETNLNLENNISIINQWKNFDTIQHKRRRCFVMKIGE